MENQFKIAAKDKEMIDIVLFCDLDWGGIWKNIKLSSLSVEWPSQHKSYLQVIAEMEMYLLWSLTILSVCVRHCQQKLFTWRYTLQVFNAWDFNRITKVMIQTSRVLDTHRSTERENSWSRFSYVTLCHSFKRYFNQSFVTSILDKL